MINCDKEISYSLKLPLILVAIVPKPYFVSNCSLTICSDVKL